MLSPVAYRQQSQQPAATSSWGVEDFLSRLWGLVKEILTCLFCCSSTTSSPVTSVPPPRAASTTAPRPVSIPKNNGIAYKELNLAGGEPPFGIHEATRLSSVFHIGIYGPTYQMTTPFFLVVKLPARCLKAFPQEVQERFVGLSDDQIELSVIIQNDIENPNTNVRNLITHTMVYPECVSNEFSSKNYFSMGMFAMQGVRSDDENNRYIFPNGFYPMDVHLHVNRQGDLSISPDNCRFEVLPNCEYASFVTAVDMRQPLIGVPEILPPHKPIPYRNKAAACFHILYRGDALYEKLKNSQNLGELIPQLPQPVQGQLRNVLQLQ